MKLNSVLILFYLQFLNIQIYTQLFLQTVFTVVAVIAHIQTVSDNQFTLQNDFIFFFLASYLSCVLILASCLILLIFLILAETGTERRECKGGGAKKKFKKSLLLFLLTRIPGRKSRQKKSYFQRLYIYYENFI